MTYEIDVTLSRIGRLIYPETTTVKVGDKLSWKLQSDSRNRTRWTLYFHHGSPFSKEEGYPHRFEVSEVAGTLLLGPFSADAPGDYKYGLRAEDPRTDARLADDDPHLIVWPA